MAFGSMFDTEFEDIAKAIVNSAIKVHKNIGPGLLESVYQKCLVYELQKAGFRVATEVSLPVKYDGIRIDAGFRIDMIVNEAVVIENKTVESLQPIHKAQIITYLKLGGYRLGFLINWNEVMLRNGIKRIIN
jgi:GxxExxY protein